MRLVADASAILAVVLDEPDAEQFLTKLQNARTVWISSVNWGEVKLRARTVLGAQAKQVLERLEQIVALEVVPLTREQAEAAHESFANFKGRPRRLNMRFAQALATEKRAPLLYKGGEFHNTEVDKLGE